MKNYFNFDFKILYFLIVVTIIGGSFCISADKLLEIGFEKSPKFNCTEKEYKPLAEVMSCSGNFGKEYIFDPWSLCVDNEGNLFGYDRLSSRIFILNSELSLLRIFGKKGNGVGDFSGSGIMAPVYLLVKNEFIYANDVIAKKVMVFDKKGNFKRKVSYHARQVKADCKPIVDDKENILFIGAENDGISLMNEKMQTIGNLKIKKEFYYYLFKKNDSMLNLDNTFKSGLMLGEIMFEVAKDGQLIILFKPSSTLEICNLSDPALMSVSRLLPRDALHAYEKELKEMKKEYFKEMFFLIFVDNNEKDKFYLQYGRNIENGKNCVYQFSTSGKLNKVLYVKSNKGDGFVRFFCKKNEMYFGITDKKIKIFMEEK